MFKNGLRQPAPLLRADAPSAAPLTATKRPARVVSLVASQLTEARKTPAQIYDRGLLRYSEGRFAEACLDFKQASQDPEQLASCVLMASRCYQHRGRPEKAAALLNAAIGRRGCTEDEAVLFRQELELLAPAEDRLPTGRAAETVATAATEAAGSGVRIEAPVATNPAVDLYAAPTSKLITVPFGVLVMALLTAGYLVRGEQYLAAETGLGYQLGIGGSLLMLVLMLYPLRKKMRLMRNWGPIPYWFRFHMLAGIVGPVMILFHANFQLGSLNSRVVLGSTLLVAGSGLFGRYLYTKIHYGLYGKRISLEQLHAAISSNQDNLAAVFIYAPKIQRRLLSFDAAVLQPAQGVLHSIGRVFMIDLRRRWTHLRIKLVLRRALKVAARRNGWSRRETVRQYRAANRLISRHLAAVLRVAEFSFYERFFSLWHVFHMPLFLLLVVALVMHVVAVHMY